ncbi:MAG: hypothetical protein KIT16_19385 [Rhodospirillaceae bacterium]|nr:hypothetical protein [Rhodospirillaceae bacterium]
MMAIDGRKLRRAGALFGLALAAAAPAAAQSARESTACRAVLAGTWLATIRTEAGAFGSRALVTLHADGSLVVIDSRQHQGVQGSSFSEQRGTYRCTGPRAARGVTLNFGFPPQETIARSDWTLVVDRAGALTGTIALAIHQGIEKADPLGGAGKRIGTFGFGAQRIAPAK